jgi:hypothetical protein
MPHVIQGWPIGEFFFPLIHDVFIVQYYIPNNLRHAPESRVRLKGEFIFPLSMV